MRNWSLLLTEYSSAGSLSLPPQQPGQGPALVREERDRHSGWLWGQSVRSRAALQGTAETQAVCDVEEGR